MVKELDIKILPHQIHDEEIFLQKIKEKFSAYDIKSHQYKIHKYSIDARRKPVYFNYKIRVYLINEKLNTIEDLFVDYNDVSNQKKIHIIGTGPAGLFAALKAVESGYKPIVYERGKKVRDRRRDLAKLNKESIVNPESNYCFGEGGAGTFSDGKLYTRSKKRGDVNKILALLVQFGATQDILKNSHPHIGTNKLPKIIENIRDFIIEMGGEVHFNSKLTDIFVENDQIKSIEINYNEIIPVHKLILATGHSARDIFHLLNDRGIDIEAKPFALGVRIEHPRALIDEIQYHSQDIDYNLPPASYSLVHQVNSRGVYSFCMCPGGIIAPCSTEQDEVVTNGWSPSKRNGKFSNSGIVVEVKPEDYDHLKQEHGELAALAYQQQVENKAWIAGGKTQVVPVQKMTDFVNHKVSKSLPDTSYVPGIKSVDLTKVLPYEISSRLQEGFKAFGRKMKGYLSDHALLHAPESRTSSPVKIPRNREDYEHVRVKGLYPCGEGAGFAGGIISAAIDGEKCVEFAVKNY